MTDYTGTEAEETTIEQLEEDIATLEAGSRGGGTGVRWPWQHREVEYMIQPRDIHLNPLSSDIITYLENEWEPFGVTAVPHTTDPNQIRLWMRRPVKFRMRRRYAIKIASAGWGGHEVLLHLTQHWKPFGVSDSYGNHLIWFWKKVER